MTILEQMGERARAAARVLACAGSRQKDEALRQIARAFREEVDAAEKAIRSYLAGEE